MIRFIITILFLAPGLAHAQDLALEREQVVEMIDSLEQRLQIIDEQLSQVDPQKREAAMIAKYGKNKGRMIAEGKVWPTISYQMAEDSWGPPTKIQKTVLNSGEAQKWIYSNSKYLYFKNGRSESWQE